MLRCWTCLDYVIFFFDITQTAHVTYRKVFLWLNFASTSCVIVDVGIWLWLLERSCVLIRVNSMSECSCSQKIWHHYRKLKYYRDMHKYWSHSSQNIGCTVFTKDFSIVTHPATSSLGSATLLIKIEFHSR